ncbi:ribosomal protein S18 acetylase RimI-like enzyme [Arthrobacter globiformis]|nr:ribosomal protein S18 acetylase RimI-like enzyme [Arthrobacter globiformis]
MGAVGVWLGMNSENAEAIRFHEKSGFERVGIKTFTLGNPGEHEFVKEYSLQPAPQPLAPARRRRGAVETKRGGVRWRLR